MNLKNITKALKTQKKKVIKSTYQNSLARVKLEHKRAPKSNANFHQNNSRAKAG